MNSAAELVLETAVNRRASAVKRPAAELTATECASLNQFIPAAAAEKAGSLRVPYDFLRERGHGETQAPAQASAPRMEGCTQRRHAVGLRLIRRILSGRPAPVSTSSINTCPTFMEHQSGREAALCRPTGVALGSGLQRVQSLASEDRTVSPSQCAVVDLSNPSCAYRSILMRNPARRASGPLPCLFQNARGARARRAMQQRPD